MKKFIFTKSHEPTKIKKAANIIKRGGILIHPTENLYGFGANFQAEDTLQRISELKKRTAKRGYILLIGKKSQLDLLVRSVNPKQQELIDKYWPGALTIIFQVKDKFHDHPAVLDGTIAVRLVGNAITRKIIKKSKSPIISTSINISGENIINDEKEIREEFAQYVDGFVIDGIHKFTKKASTIVEVKNNTIKIIRQGAVKLLN